MKISLITMHAARNYGAVLQTYALQKYLENKGNVVEIINYKRKDQTFIGYLFNINQNFRKTFFHKLSYVIVTFIPKIRTSIIFGKFQERKLHLSGKTILDYKQIKDVISADYYCVGSDQVWNPYANNGFDKAFFLSGVKGKKISYASSIGIYEFNNDEQACFLNEINNFSSISVREISSVSLLQKMGIKSTCVLDPTLLLGRDEWEKFADPIISSKPYILVYYFGNAKNIMKSAERVAKARNLEIRRITVGYERYSSDNIIERFITPERFVGLFLNASYVITNSFHGTIFSINFEKQFLGYPTTENNARFDSVFQMFDLQERNLRKYSGEEYINLSDVDYARVARVLAEKREESYTYLKRALQDEV